MKVPNVKVPNVRVPNVRVPNVRVHRVGHTSSRPRGITKQVQIAEEQQFVVH